MESAQGLEDRAAGILDSWDSKVSLAKAKGPFAVPPAAVEGHAPPAGDPRRRQTTSPWGDSETTTAAGKDKEGRRGTGFFWHIPNLP